MKKLLVSLLVATTTLSFVGCGAGKKADENTTGGDNKDKKVNLKVQVEEDWIPYYEKVKETVNKEYPNANIEFIVNGSFDHLEILDSTDATNADVADIFAFPTDKFYGLAKNNILSALDAEKMAEKVGGYKNFKDGIGKTYNIDGDYLAFPFNIETLIAFVNVENAKTQNIDFTKPVEFTKLKYDQLLVVPHTTWYGVAFANSVGFEFLQKDENDKLYSDATKEFDKLTKEQQDMFKALFDYWKAHKEAGTPLWDMSAAGGYMDEQFKTGGNDALKIEGPWATPGVKELAGAAENVEVIPLTNILVNGKELKHWQSGWALGVNARCEEDEATMDVAKAFIQEIVNPKNASELFKYTGRILANADESAFANADETDKKVIKATYESFEKAEVRPLFSEYNQVWETWQNAVLSWDAKNPKDVVEAYNEIKASFVAMMQNFNQ